MVSTNGKALDAEQAIGLIRQATRLREDVALTLTAEMTSQDIADVLDHPELSRIVERCEGLAFSRCMCAGSLRARAGCLV